MSLLEPSEAFGIVESGFYRSSMPNAASFPFLKELGLKTVVILSPETLSRTVADFFDLCDTTTIHLGATAWKPDGSWKPISEELIKEGLEYVLNADFYPIMVMCTSGIQQTGMLVACLRRMQTWTLTSILNEYHPKYHMFAGSKSRYINEQFIELFDLDLVTMPSKQPEFFSRQLELLNGGSSCR